MKNCCICWFYAYINEMHGSRRKIPSKNLVRQRCVEGFHSRVKGLSKYLWSVVYCGPCGSAGLEWGRELNYRLGIQDWLC
jgi:hypothetical protein